jgi:arabinofuranosyltransferase
MKTPGEETGGTLHRIVFAAAVFLVLGLGLQVAFSREWGADDAYISFRYASNLAGGRGLVFNPGERVEGYTNFLYILVLTAGVTIFRVSHYAVAVVANVVALALVLVIFVRHVGGAFGREAARWAAAFVVLCPVFYRWVPAGLETPIVFLFQMLLWVLTERSVSNESASADEPAKDSLSSLFALGAITFGCVLIRADGFVFPIVAASYLLVHARRRAGLAVAITTAVTLGAHVAWRLSYYGYPLPNTYYAKVSGPLVQRVLHGAGDLAEIGVRACLLPPVVAIAWAAVVALRNAGQRQATAIDLLRALPFESWIAGALLPLWVYVGGDVYEERFLLILYPAGFLSLMRIVSPARTSVTRAAAAAFVVLQLLVVVRFDYVSLPKYDQFLSLGEFLRDRYPAERSIAIDGAGKVPYVTRMTSIDILGLNDLYLGHMATTFFVVGHNKYDAPYIMRRRPNLIAAWLDMGASAIDLDWGLTESLYARNGYRLRYVLNTTEVSDGRDIVDVAGYADPEIRALTLRGYRYAVLERL